VKHSDSLDWRIHDGDRNRNSIDSYREIIAMHEVAKSSPAEFTT